MLGPTYANSDLKLESPVTYVQQLMLSDIKELDEKMYDLIIKHAQSSAVNPIKLLTFILNSIDWLLIFLPDEDDNLVPMLKIGPYYILLSDIASNIENIHINADTDLNTDTTYCVSHDLKLSTLIINYLLDIYTENMTFEDSLNLKDTEFFKQLNEQIVLSNLRDIYHFLYNAVRNLKL